MARLISPSEVKNKAINAKNFDVNLILDSYILAAELDDIKPILGDDLYDDIIANQSNYTTLLVYIKNALAFYVLIKALPFIYTHIVNRGVVVNYGDGEQVVTGEEKSDILTALKRMAEAYLNELLRYLEDNGDNYTYWYGGSRKVVGGIIF